MLNTDPAIQKLEYEKLDISNNNTIIREEIVEEEIALGGTFVKVNF